MSRGLAQRLREAGFKLTLARKVVLQVLEEESSPLSPAEVLARGQRLYPNLSRATVYRTLHLLSSLGLFRPLPRERGTGFVWVGEGHHRLICSSCGAVFAFDSCLVCKLEPKVTMHFGFLIRGHLLEFYGLCRDCHDRKGGNP